MGSRRTRRPCAGPRALLAAVVLAGLAAAGPAAFAGGVLRVAYNSEWAPYSAGAGDAVHGILPDIVEALAGAGGVAVSHHGYPWKRAQKLVQEGSMDAFVTFPSKARLEYVHSTRNVVYSVEMHAVVRRDSDVGAALARAPGIEGLRTLRGCVMLGDGWSAAFFAKHGLEYGSGTDTENCLRQLAGGRVDVFIHAGAAVRRVIGLAGLDDVLEVQPYVYDSVPMTLMVAKEATHHAGVVEAVDDVLARMKQDGSYDALIERVRAANQ